MGYALTSKRQVTIPLQICEHLGIGPGREIDYLTLEDGRVVIAPIVEKSTAFEAAIAKWRGTSPLKKSTAEIMRETRGDESMQ
jgi:bifunctional DNA-binding transcriptional regulator/antitoxin component of YhaV-PrlF toxin-antitoxin module